MAVRIELRLRRSTLDIGCSTFSDTLRPHVPHRAAFRRPSPARWPRARSWSGPRASVIKELVENSIDAGATRIEVMIRRGGISYIRVVDDGVRHGPRRRPALPRKTRHEQNPHGPRSRGHPRRSASAAKRCRASPASRASASPRANATRSPAPKSSSNAGKIESVRDGGDAPGTQIEVRSLFYNLPARRKFLRTENTESSHVEHQLHLQAIGHPHDRLHAFVNDERVVYQLPPAANHLRERESATSAARRSPRKCSTCRSSRLDADGISIRGLHRKAQA